VDLREPLTRLLGGATAAALAKLGLETADDLLRHYPRRYVERGELTDLSQLVVGEHVTIAARVKSASAKWLEPTTGGKRRHMLRLVVTDGSDTLPLTFFNAPWHAKRLAPGVEALFAGKVESFRGQPRLTNPQVEDADPEDVDGFAGALVPIYSASSSVQTWQIATSVGVLLDSLPRNLPDPVPALLRARARLPALSEALRLVHRPATRADVSRARHRFAYEEALVLQAVLAQRRHATSLLPATPRRPVADGLLDAFDARLPFRLTAGQHTVGAQIAADLAASHPMHRLLHGEVGSGKTLVAVRAMLTVADSGGQSALLAPTEVLAQQHYRSIRALLGPLAEGGLLGGDERGTQVVLLTGSQPAAARRAALLATVSGDAGIVVGTHALLEERVDFADLGLVVVDEQHRFGVEQRDALRAKAAQPPHVLVMTATPIPRTVAITVFGDLDVSVLEEMPAGRSPITTFVVPGDRPGWLDRAWERVGEEVAAGHRVYVVCPRIGDADNTDADSTDGDGRGGDEAGRNESDGPAAALWDAPPARPALAVLDVLADVRARLPGRAVEALHGRMPAEDKDDVMRRFAGGEVQVLVATTVVEVGVDVAEATVMVVLDADRFGVSQLHQLRGRVGRGASPGLCLLVTEVPDGGPARRRLDAVAATLDGFELSRLDLQQRHEGDVLGSTQSGRRSSLRMLSVLRDEDLIRAAREAATRLVAADPGGRRRAGCRGGILPDQGVTGR
jgi:ATP-dependent DNA helicase RecG